MKAVVFSGSGGNEVVHLETRPTPRPGRREVLIGVEFAGINPADIAQRRGVYPAPAGVPADIPGLEVAGVVLESGSGARQWTPGKRVFGIVSGGGLADAVVAHESH